MAGTTQTYQVFVHDRGRPATEGEAAVAWRPVRTAALGREVGSLRQVSGAVDGEWQRTDVGGHVALEIPPALFPIELCAAWNGAETVVRRVLTAADAAEGIRFDVAVTQAVTIAVVDDDGEPEPGAIVRVREFRPGELLPEVGVRFSEHLRLTAHSAVRTAGADGRISFDSRVGAVLVITVECSGRRAGSRIWGVPASSSGAPSWCELRTEAAASDVRVRLVGATADECALIGEENGVTSWHDELSLPPVPLGRTPLVFTAWSPARAAISVGGPDELHTVTLTRPQPHGIQLRSATTAPIDTRVRVRRAAGRPRGVWVRDVCLSPDAHLAPPLGDSWPFVVEISAAHEGQWGAWPHWVSLGEIARGSAPLECAVPLGASVALAPGSVDDAVVVNFDFIEVGPSGATQRGSLRRVLRPGAASAIRLLGRTPAIATWDIGDRRGSTWIENRGHDAVTIDTTAASPWTCRVRVCSPDGAPLAGVVCSEWNTAGGERSPLLGVATNGDGIATIGLVGGDAALIRGTANGARIGACVVRRDRLRDAIHGEIRVVPPSILSVRVVSEDGTALSGVVVHCGIRAEPPRSVAEVTDVTGSASFLLEHGHHRVWIGDGDSETPVLIDAPRHALALRVP